MLLPTLNTVPERIAFAIHLLLKRSPPLSVLAFLLVAPHSVTAASQSPRHVLLIYGDQKDLPMNLIVDDRLRSIFREQLNDGADLFSEYLDASRFPDKRS